ncbi:concentrative nucleoside transporter, CNT family [Microlunatus sagamiharensis]|uniref:Concentrative nucleoside transporter, CNT family n=1 Tax=Microlunatus sagamiharensis TaxID=546874 RepID=A0A1H2MYQ4_9ACTN|nr:nucleoside transporter C-terminal domain-containing protein [Microlunatus sagamiharensis]SDU98212.1 concentrative nucleoside transporter, CNT family [Microlunatus sagamiharensis]
MDALRGLLGLVLLLGIAVLASRDRRGIRWRTVGVALAVQVVFAFLVLRTRPGQAVLDFLSRRVETLIGYTQSGTDFVFGPLAQVGAPNGVAFALQVLPVIIFLGALIYLLLYLRVIQLATHYVGGAIGRLLRVSKVESMYAAVVVFLGMSEAPLLISPYLKRLTSAQLFTVVVAGLTAASGSTLIGYALLGAPLPYLLAATVMNAPAALVMAKIMWPDSVREPVEAVEGSGSSTAAPAEEPEPAAAPRATGADDDFDVRDVRDTESANAIDALARGALAGGRVAVTIAALLVAFVALIALANGIIGGIAGWFGVEGLTFQQLLGYVMAPVAWLLGVPWSESVRAGQFIGIKTVLNEFVAYGEFGAQVGSLSPVTVVVVSFALAGFANFGSIAIAIGALGSLRAQIRGFVARVGVRALLAATLANLANAAIAGLVFAR